MVVVSNVDQLCYAWCKEREKKPTHTHKKTQSCFVGFFISPCSPESTLERRMEGGEMGKLLRETRSTKEEI